MAERVVFLAKGKGAEPTKHLIREGQWFPDGWMTARLLIEVKELSAARRVTLRGFNPDVSMRLLGNILTVAIDRQEKAQSLPWGNSFEIPLPLQSEMSGTCTLSIAASGFLEPDLMDQRERAVLLSSVTFED
jgi:hypothetical protein